MILGVINLFNLVNMAMQKYSKKSKAREMFINLIRTLFVKNTKKLIFVFFLFLNFNLFSNAHIKGTYSSEQDAEKKSLDLGCVGIHKNQDKWLPCKNEKELHKYLRK